MSHVSNISQDCKGPDIAVSPCEAHQARRGRGNLSPTSVNVWIAWNTHFLIIARAPSKFGNFFYLSLSLYFWSVILHCSCSVSSASHFLWHCLQTNCDVAGGEQKQFEIFRGIFTRWVRLVGGGFCNKANLLSFTSTSNDHNRHESVNFSA